MWFKLELYHYERSQRAKALGFGKNLHKNQCRSREKRPQGRPYARSLKGWYLPFGWCRHEERQSSEGCLSDLEENMKKNITVVTVVALILIVGSFLMGQSTPKLPPVASAITGRYQIVLNPNVRADLFLLDSQTGKVWIPIECSNCAGKPTRWKYMDRVDNEKEDDDWASKQSIEQPDTK